MFFFGFDPRIKKDQKPELGIEVKRIHRSQLHELSVNGSYKQIAGLGVIQMASLALGVDILTSSIDDISKEFSYKIG